jgi:hypothetical protein
MESDLRGKIAGQGIEERCACLREKEATWGIKKMQMEPPLGGLLLSLNREKRKCQPPTLISAHFATHTSGGLPAPRTIFSSIIARTISLGSPMPTAM